MAKMNLLTPKIDVLTVDQFRGINLSVTPSQIDQRESPDMLNMNIDERGALNKRTGYKRLNEYSMGSGQINGMQVYRKPNGEDEFLFAFNNKLYATLRVPGRGEPIEPMWTDDDLETAWEV